MAAAGTVIEVKVEQVLDVVGDKPLSGAARAAVDRARFSSVSATLRITHALVDAYQKCQT